MLGSMLFSLELEDFHLSDICSEKKEFSCLVMEYSQDSAAYDIFQDCLNNSIVPHNVHLIRLKEALKK